MRLSSEAALMLLALALYVYDALILLASNEAVLVRRARGWAAVFGAFNWRLAGKEPCAPGLFAPHRALVRLHWRFEGAPAAAGVRPVHTRADLRALAVCTWLSLLTLFGLLPWALFAQAGVMVTLGVIALLYVVNVAALALLYRVHKRQQGPAMRYWTTAFECLVCPPFCINLLRRVYEWEGCNEDLLLACERLLPPEARHEVYRQCLVRLDEQIDGEDDASARLAALRRTRAHLQSREKTA